MKHRKQYIVIFSLIIIGIIIMTRNTYYMAHIKSITFPEDVIVLDSQVSTSAVYGWHVLAEEIIETTLSWDNVSAIVANSPKGEKINVFPIYFKENGETEILEWDDYSTNLVDSLDNKSKEGMNYYLINEHTQYGSFIFW